MTIDGDVGSWGGWAASGLIALGAWWNARRKTDVDESALVLGKWKELVEQHQSSIAAIRDEFATYKQTAIAELKDMRDRLSLAEGRIRELETENAGLKRMIAQNSQSTAHMIQRATVPGRDKR